MANRTRKPTRSQRASAGSVPDVILDVIFDDGLLFLAVRNISLVPAHKVSVAFDSPVVGMGGREISALPLFKNIEFLAPGREIRTLLDASASYFARGQPTRVTARIAYHDDRRGRHTRAIAHDLEIYREIGYVQKTPEQKEGAQR